MEKIWKMLKIFFNEIPFINFFLKLFKLIWNFQTFCPNDACQQQIRVRTNPSTFIAHVCVGVKFFSVSFIFSVSLIVFTPKNISVSLFLRYSRIFAFSVKKKQKTLHKTLMWLMMMKFDAVPSLEWLSTFPFCLKTSHKHPTQFFYRLSF